MFLVCLTCLLGAVKKNLMFWLAEALPQPFVNLGDISLTNKKSVGFLG
jgi:hypothetical protein